MTCTCKPGIQGTMPLETSSSVYPVPCTRHPNGLTFDDKKWGEDIPWWAYLPTEDLRKVGEKKQAEIERLRRQVKGLTKHRDAIERARPLCPDCHDKCREEACIRCRWQAAERRVGDLEKALILRCHNDGCFLCRCIIANGASHGKSCFYYKIEAEVEANRLLREGGDDDK